MARRNHEETLRDEFKRQLRGFGGEAAHQLGSGWGEEFARQIFGTPARSRRGRHR